jgi:hypothetical protein
MDNLTIKEIIKKDLVDDACAVLRWEEFQEKKKKLDKMTVGEIFKQGFGDDAIEIFTQMNINKRNEYYTQRRSFNQIAKYIPKGKVIWEAFTRGSHDRIQSPQYLRDLGFEVIATGEDFFNCDYGDIVVSNPPYTNTLQKRSHKLVNLKSVIIERLIKMNKPFMLLLPTYYIQSKTFTNIHQQHKDEFQFLIPPENMDFQMLNEQGKLIVRRHSHQYCMWFCWRIGLERQVTFLI